MFRSQDKVTNEEMFSQETVDAFRTYMKEQDDGPLSRIFEPRYLRTLKQNLAVDYGYGVPDEEMIQQAMVDVTRMYESRLE